MKANTLAALLYIGGILVALGITAAIAHGDVTPPAVQANTAFHNLTVRVSKQVGGKAHVISTSCVGPVKGRTLFTCTLKSIGIDGHHACQRYVVGFRPGYKLLVWAHSWACTEPVTPLPPVPPASAYLKAPAKGPAA